MWEIRNNEEADELTDTKALLQERIKKHFSSQLSTHQITQIFCITVVTFLYITVKGICSFFLTMCAVFCFMLFFHLAFLPFPGSTQQPGNP